MIRKYLTFNAWALSDPVIMNTTFAALLITGKVKVTLCGGGFGLSEIGATT